MKFSLDYSSRFRILKGGKVSLVVSALLVGASLLTPAHALQVTDAKTTTQEVAENADLELTSSGSIDITANGTDYSGLYVNGNLNDTYAVSNSGIINITNTDQTSTMRGILIGGDNDGTISNLGSATITINSTSTSSSRAVGIDLDDNNGDIILNGGDISVSSVSDAWGLFVNGNHNGTITNSALLSTTVNTSDFNNNAIGVYISGDMTNASIDNSDTIYSEGNKNETYGLLVEGKVTDSIIMNSGTIDIVGKSTSEAYGIYLEGGTAGTTTITNTHNKFTTDGIIKVSSEDDAKAIFISGDSVGTITNSGRIEATGGGDYSFGIHIDGDFTGDIDNYDDGSQIIVNNNGSGVAKAIVVEGTFTGDLNNNIIDVDALVEDATGIEIETVAAASTVTNQTDLYVNTNEGDATGVFVETNEGIIDNDNGFIGVYSRDGEAKGIYVEEGSGTIINTGAIIVESTNSFATGIHSSSNDITNSYVVFAHKGDYELDWKAFAINSEKGDINNTNRLHGNLLIDEGTLTNSGEIFLPHNANSEFWAWADDFTNQSTGTLTIGLQTDGASILSYSTLGSNSATFEDGSTINVDVTTASTNVGNITGERLNDVVWTKNSLTINGTINVTDNSALLNFELIEDEDSINDGKTIDLAVIGANTNAGAGGNIENTSNLGGAATNTLSSAKVLDTIKSKGTHTAMNTVFDALDNLPTNESVAKAVESTTPQTVSATVGASAQISNGIAGIVEQRQNVNIEVGLSGGNSGDELLAQRNIWLKPFGSVGKQNDKEDINGFDLKAYGFGIGVDGEYKPSQNFGLALFYTRANVDVNNVNQESNLDVVTALTYGNVPIIDDKTNLLYQVGYAWQMTDSTRNVFTGDVASSDYTSKTASLDLKLIRDYQVNNNLLLQPMITTTYRHYTNSSYKETGAGALNLNVQEFTSSELLLGLGTMIHYKLDDDSKIVSNINVDYDLHDREQTVTSSFQGAAGVNFSTRGIDNGRWSYDIGVGYERDINETSNLNISYNRQGQGSDFTNNVISAKYVYKF